MEIIALPNSNCDNFYTEENLTKFLNEHNPSSLTLSLRTTIDEEIIVYDKPYIYIEDVKYPIDYCRWEDVEEVGILCLEEVLKILKARNILPVLFIKDKNKINYSEIIQFLKYNSFLYHMFSSCNRHLELFHQLKLEGKIHSDTKIFKLEYQFKTHPYLLDFVDGYILYEDKPNRKNSITQKNIDMLVKRNYEIYIYQINTHKKAYELNAISPYSINGILTRYPNIIREIF